MKLIYFYIFLCLFFVSLGCKSSKNPTKLKSQVNQNNSTFFYSNFRLTYVQFQEVCIEILQSHCEQKKDAFIQLLMIKSLDSSPSSQKKLKKSIITEAFQGEVYDLKTKLDWLIYEKNNSYYLRLSPPQEKLEAIREQITSKLSRQTSSQVTVVRGEQPQFHILWKKNPKNLGIKEMMKLNKKSPKVTSKSFLLKSLYN